MINLKTVGFFGDAMYIKIYDKSEFGQLSNINTCIYISILYKSSNIKLNSSNQDSWSLRIKNIEKDLAQKNEEVLRLKNELDGIKKRYDEKDKFETEILNNHQNNLSKIFEFI
jgi:hypothetical protein